MFFITLACDGERSEESGFVPDTGVDSGETDSADSGGGALGGSLNDADVLVAGETSSATGGALFVGPDSDGDGANSVWVSAYFRSINCRFEGQLGSVTLADAPLCIRQASTTEYTGYALSSNGTTVAMGAIGGNTFGSYSGKLYLFDEGLAPGTYAESAAFAQVYGEAQGDYAGMALAYVGDTNGDGTADLLVGAPSNDEFGAGSGKAYLFANGDPADGMVLSDAGTVVIGSSPVLGAKHGAPEAGDGVGSVLNGAGDVNGDGLADIVFGCNGADDGGTDAGLAALFYGPVDPGEVALRSAGVVWVGDVPGRYLGDFVDGIGDADGDGYDDVLVSGDMAEAGRAWIFAGPGTSGTVAQVATSFVGTAVSDYLGASFAGVGDVDANGLPDVAIGAYGNDVAGLDAGATYLFLAPFAAGSWATSDAAATWTGQMTGDASGRQVEAAGDYNGDGFADLAVGAPYSDVGGPFSGAAYLLFGGDG